jgi:hypothetical protein
VIYADAQHSDGVTITQAEAKNEEVSAVMCVLLIPEYDPEDSQPYPGDIQPEEYGGNEIVELLREYAENPEAIRFIADMMEE